ncbi:unnamed protein product [Cylindrotheca closterium]|uniref:Uncharacterized protein n=1 Tax=Cylindrotheca closterium TaxID=2856 RepID=A0AAD2CHH5_9STRA|nr:unnamed protein product [Cylindrotheca closterium]
MGISDIIDQNNRGVSLLMENDFPNAIQSFALALPLLRTIADSVWDHTICDGDSLDQHMISSADCADQVKPASSAANNGMMIYQVGIRIPPTETIPSIISWVLIFNSALAHHLSAKTRACPAMLKAKQLYRLICDPQGMTQSPLFQYAVINNLGVIEQNFGNASVANQYFEILPSIPDLREDLQAYGTDRVSA